MTRAQSIPRIPSLVAVLLVAVIALGVLEWRSAERGDAFRGDDSAGERGAPTEAADAATPAQSSRGAARSSALLDASNSEAADLAAREQSAIDAGAVGPGGDIVIPIPIPSEFLAFFERHEHLAAFHAKLEREPEEAAWAASVERVLQDHLNVTIDPSSYRVLSVECRSTACEILAVGYGDDAMRGWMAAAKELFDSGVVEELFPKPGQAGCGGGDAGPGVFMLNCTFERVDPALAGSSPETYSLDAPYADGVSFERVDVPQPLVPLIETSVQVYDLHRRLEREPTDLSWSSYIEPLLAEYLANIDGADAIDIAGIACRTSLCEVQIISSDDSALINLMANLPEFQQQSWHDLTSAGMNGNEIEDGASGLVWILQRSAR